MDDKVKERRKVDELSPMNPNAAGIDVGAESHFVAVPPDRDDRPVQEFRAFTSDLYKLAGWLTSCGVDTVAMESTGVYWIPLFGVLEERGFEVILVDPRRLKNVPGRPDASGWTASGCNGSIPMAFSAGLSDRRRTSDNFGATFASGPCWSSTHPGTSSICRRR